MNHLAHLFLSQSSSDLMIGNFIADQVKGKKILDYSDRIQNGIKMHRDIDSFTDHHPIVQQSKKRLYPKYHKYASVIVDIYYDHILAKNWRDYSPIKLESFSAAAYQVLNGRKEEYPKSSQHILYYMSKSDWLSHYATIEGIGKALNGLASRATFDSKMEESNIDLERDFKAYEKEFQAFFPELVAHIQAWLIESD